MTRKDREEVLPSHSALLRLNLQTELSNLLLGLSRFWSFGGWDRYTQSGTPRTDIQWSNKRVQRHFHEFHLPSKDGKTTERRASHLYNQYGLNALCYAVPSNPLFDELMKSVGGTSFWFKSNGHKMWLDVLHTIGQNSNNRDWRHVNKISLPVKSGKPVAYLGILRGPGKTTPQRSHHDFHHQVLKKYAGHLYIAFTPLTNDGYFIQVWPKDKPNDVRLLYIPYGAILILPGDTLHRGGFCTS